MPPLVQTCSFQSPLRTMPSSIDVKLPSSKPKMAGRKGPDTRPSSSGQTSTPSSVVPVGSVAFETPASVGKMSTSEIGSSMTSPAGSSPGHLNRAGTRMPPSNWVSLPPLSGFAVPPSMPYCSHGPLSERKITRV